MSNFRWKDISNYLNREVNNFEDLHDVALEVATREYENVANVPTISRNEHTWQGNELFRQSDGHTVVGKHKPLSATIVAAHETNFREALEERKKLAYQCYLELMNVVTDLRSAIINLLPTSVAHHLDLVSTKPKHYLLSGPSLGFLNFLRPDPLIRYKLLRTLEFRMGISEEYLAQVQDCLDEEPPPAVSAILMHEATKRVKMDPGKRKLLENAGASKALMEDFEMRDEYHFDDGQRGKYTLRINPKDKFSGQERRELLAVLSELDARLKVFSKLSYVL